MSSTSSDMQNHIEDESLKTLKSKLGAFKRKHDRLSDYLLQVVDDLKPEQDPRNLRNFFAWAFEDDKYLKYVSLRDRDNLDSMIRELIHDEYGPLYKRVAFINGKKSYHWSIGSVRNFYKIADLGKVDWAQYIVFGKFKFQLPMSCWDHFYRATETHDPEFPNPSLECITKAFDETMEIARKTVPCTICKKIGHWKLACPDFDPNYKQSRRTKKIPVEAKRN